MRVLYLHQYFSTPSGPGGLRSYQLAKGLVARGHDVLMVCASTDRAYTGLSGPFHKGRRRGIVDGFEVLEFDLRYSNKQGLLKRAAIFMQFAARSIAVAFTEHYDILFASSTPLTAGIPGIFARWLRRKPFVFEVRDLWPELPRAMGVIRDPFILWAMSALEWTTYHSATRLVGLAPGIVEGIVRRGIDRARVALIPNGCDIDIFEGIEGRWRPAGVGADDLMVVFAGAHGRANGLDAVLDASIELRNRGRTDIKIVLIGDGQLKPRLQRRALDENLTSVIFHDSVSKNRLAGLTAAADLGLQILDNVPAFYFGTSPNKFFDYLSAGLPVLINYPGWLADLVRQHRCGYAVPPGDPRAFADALTEAAENRSALKAMGTQASLLAKSQFDREKLARQFAEWMEAAA
jgi:glycosyltransferase involved in cell wall biosynthesis